MRAIDWQKFLQGQHDKYGKVIFTRTELANASSLEPSTLKVSLPRLIKQGVIERYTKGRYGLPGIAAVEDLVSSIDTGAYVTGLHVLYRHHLVTQASVEVTCFTRRRHNRSRVRETSLGRIVFIRIEGSVYAYPSENTGVSIEQAFCDFVYLCRKRGVDPLGIVTFRNLGRVNLNALQQHLQRYPSTVKHHVEGMIHGV